MHAYSQVEFDWLAIDLDGAIGYLSTAGYGPVPAASLEDGAFLETLLDRLLTLAPRSEVKSATLTFPADWLEVARRGLYAYDWSHSHDRYELIAAPAQPAFSITNPEIQRVAMRVRLPLRFADSPSIAPADIV